MFVSSFSWQVSYASLCMDSGSLESILEKKDAALGKVEHAVAQKHLDKPKVMMSSWHVNVISHVMHTTHVKHVR